MAGVGIELRRLARCLSLSSPQQHTHTATDEQVGGSLGVNVDVTTDTSVRYTGNTRFKISPTVNAPTIAFMARSTLTYHASCVTSDSTQLELANAPAARFFLLYPSAPRRRVFLQAGPVPITIDIAGTLFLDFTYSLSASGAWALRSLPPHHRSRDDGVSKEDWRGRTSTCWRARSAAALPEHDALTHYSPRLPSPLQPHHRRQPAPRWVSTILAPSPTASRTSHHGMFRA